MGSWSQVGIGEVRLVDMGRFGGWSAAVQEKSRTKILRSKEGGKADVQRGFSEPGKRSRGGGGGERKNGERPTAVAMNGLKMLSGERRAR